MGGGDRGKRYGPSRRLTRRRFIGGAMSLGGGALLAACGATATPQADAIVVSTPAAASATRTVGVPGTSTRAPASAGTATPTLAATPTINGASATELGRLLGLLPQTESLPGRTGIWFADVARQKRNYGYERLTSIEAVRALPGGVVAFSNAVGKLPLPTEAGIRPEPGHDWKEHSTAPGSRQPCSARATPGCPTGTAPTCPDSRMVRSG